MKRKIVVAVLCGILTISSLAGCGNTQVEETEPTAVEEPTVEEETPADGEEAVKETAEEVIEEVEAEEPEQPEQPEQPEKYICLAETVYNADGSVQSLTKYICNESGDTLEGTCYDMDGNVVSSTLYEYEYDTDGNKIKETENWTNTQNNLSSSILREYEYDTNGNMMKLKLNNSDVEGFYIDEYEYDANGNVTKNIYTHFDGDGNVTVTNSHEYEYDTNGNKIKHIYTDEMYSFLYEYENEYDANGNIIKYICNSMNEDGTELGTDLSEYKYDAENRLFSETFYDSMGEIIYYEYDEHGNNIRHIQYDEFLPSFCAEYKYMELQDYLDAKESIDAEEVECVNTESIESILSGLGISPNNN